MDGIHIGTALLAILLLFLVGGVWIGMTLALVGYFGLLLFTDRPPGPNLFTTVWGSAASWELAALPLFIWMGEILFRTKLSDQMFEGLAPWVDRIPGRLMHVNVLGCGIFGSVSGSSAATCATISKVALPELLKRGYDEKVALGSLATAGTLGLLIPPSITMVVYAVAADTSIIRVFLAGFIPGALLMALFSGYIVVWALLNPHKTPAAGPRIGLADKLRRSGQLIPCALLILFILWALVAGVATATECAAYGVLGSLAIAWQGGSLTWANFSASLMGATRVSCMISFILAGAAFLKMAMAFTGVPLELAAWVNSLQLSPYMLIFALTVHLRDSRNGTGRCLDDRADGGHRDPDGAAGRLRPRLVRHLRCAPGGDLAGHAASGLQPLRPAEYDGQGQPPHCPRGHPVLLLHACLHRHRDRLAQHRHLAA